MYCILVTGIYVLYGRTAYEGWPAFCSEKYFPRLIWKKYSQRFQNGDKIALFIKKYIFKPAIINGKYI